MLDSALFEPAWISFLCDQLLAKILPCGHRNSTWSYRLACSGKLITMSPGTAPADGILTDGEPRGLNVLHGKPGSFFLLMHHWKRCSQWLLLQLCLEMNTYEAIRTQLAAWSQCQQTVDWGELLSVQWPDAINSIYKHESHWGCDNLSVHYCGSR